MTLTLAFYEHTAAEAVAALDRWWRAERNVVTCKTLAVVRPFGDHWEFTVDLEMRPKMDQPTLGLLE